MYKPNNYKNNVNTDLGNLESILLIFSDSKEEINIYAIGGTAMILKNHKPTTKDIDFITTNSKETIKKILSDAGLKENRDGLVNVWYYEEKIRIDIFYGNYIVGVELLEDWKEKSEHIRTIGNCKLYILNWYDVIIPKIARNEERDIEDILIIIKNENIDFEKLRIRYFQTMENSIVSHAEYNFKVLEIRWNQQN